jgi:hypothetical protein
MRARHGVGHGGERNLQVEIGAVLDLERPSLTQQPPRRQHAQRPSVSPLPSPSRREKSRQAHNSAIYARILAAIDKWQSTLA